MGAIPFFGQERLFAVCFCLLLKLVCFFLFSTASCNKYSLMPSNLCITWQNAVPVWEPHFFSWDINAHSDLCLIPKRRFPKGQAWYSNPPFGGRGSSIIIKSYDRPRKVTRIVFNDTLGFPGEGWSELHDNLKITT